MGRATVLVSDISFHLCGINQMNLNLTSLTWTIKAHQCTVYTGVKSNPLNQKRNLGD